MTRDQAVLVRDAAADLIRAIDASEKASAARAALGPGSSRARVTSANARWKGAAEHRDHCERRLRMFVEAS